MMAQGVAEREGFAPDEVTDIDVTLITKAYKRGHLLKSGLLTVETRT